MGDYRDTIGVDVPPDRLFAYLADVENLPTYLPRMTSAVPEGGDRVEVTARVDPGDGAERDVRAEAWVQVLEEGRSLRWGAPGPHEYHGELHVAPGDAEGGSQLTVVLHTERVEGTQIDDGLVEVLQGVKQAVEAAES